MNKINIRSIDIQAIRNFCTDIGEKSFKAEQIYAWLWQKGAKDFDAMSNISKNLREELKKKFYIDNVTIIQLQKSKDKTIKTLFTTLNTEYFEGVLIPSNKRVTACISTQVGCPLNCSFCATGKLGFKRNLNIGEIFGQVFALNELSLKEYGRYLTNIVVMGMGEPLLNYDNTISTLKILNSEKSIGMSPSRITLSTAGIAPKIKQLADDDIKFNLSISLHAADNYKRDKIMPINKKYNLNELSTSLKYFYDKTGKRVTYEYLLIKDFNDSIKDAENLSRFTKISPCKINLIKYNRTNEKDKFMPSELTTTKKFIEYLKNKNLVVTLRQSKGEDISAACGQLANKKH